MWCERAKGYQVVQKDMIWFRFQLFRLTADHPQTSDMTSLSLSFLIFRNGASASCELVVRIRDNLQQGPAQSLVHRSYPQELREAMYTGTNDEQNKMVLREIWWDVNRALGTHQVEMSPEWFHGRVCLGWALKDGQDADRPWEEGRFHKKEKLWRK